MLTSIPAALLTTTCPRSIRGTSLAKNKRSPKVRAQLAAELHDGRSVVTWLTDGQHRSEIARRLLAAAAVGSSASDRRDQVERNNIQPFDPGLPGLGSPQSWKQGSWRTWER